jgi:hypothetical protein
MTARTADRIAGKEGDHEATKSTKGEEKKKRIRNG